MRATVLLCPLLALVPISAAAQRPPAGANAQQPPTRSTDAPRTIDGVSTVRIEQITIDLAKSSVTILIVGGVGAWQHAGGR